MFDGLKRKPTVVEPSCNNVALTGVLSQLVNTVTGVCGESGVVLLWAVASSEMETGVDSVDPDTWQMRFATIHTGVGSKRGSDASHDVSRLGAIIFAVMMAGLYGHMPVFQNADDMISGLSAQIWAAL